MLGGGPVACVIRARLARSPLTLGCPNLRFGSRNAGARRRSPAASQDPPVAARWPGAVERVERRSGRQIALGRCAARVGWIDGRGVAAEVFENPFDDGGRLDAGDDAQPAAALPADAPSANMLVVAWRAEMSISATGSIACKCRSKIAVNTIQPVYRVFLREGLADLSSG